MKTLPAREPDLTVSGGGLMVKVFGTVLHLYSRGQCFMFDCALNEKHAIKKAHEYTLRGV